MKTFLISIYFFLIIGTVALFSSCENAFRIFGINGTYVCVDGCFIKSITFKDGHVYIDYLGFTNLGGDYDIHGGKIYIRVMDFNHSLDIVNNNVLKGNSFAIFGTYVKEGHLEDYHALLLGHYTVSAYKLNVRSGPGTSHKSLGTLRKGDKIEVTEIIDRDWCKINTKNKAGYVSRKFIQRIAK